MMGSQFPPAQNLMGLGLIPRKRNEQSNASRRSRQEVTPKAHLLAGLKPLQVDWKTFGGGDLNVRFKAQGEPPQAGPVYEKAFYIKDEPDLLTPKGQVHRLSDSLKDAVSNETKPVPEQVVLRLVYENQPPVPGIRVFLNQFENDLKGNGWRVKIARLAGLPKRLPKMALEHKSPDAKEIAFVVDTKPMSHQEINDFAKFLTWGNRFLPKKYEE